MRGVLTGIVLTKITYGAIIWANKASNYKRHFDRVQRLDLLAMAHICCPTSTAGLEAILGITQLDLHTQCVAVQVACRIRVKTGTSGMALGVVTFGDTFSRAIAPGTGGPK